MSSRDTEDSPDRLSSAEDAFARAENAESPEDAVDLYSEIVDELRGSSDDRTRALLIRALNEIAAIESDAGGTLKGRLAASEVVTDHFDDAPTEVVDVVPQSVFALARYLDADGHDDRAIELMTRLIARYGQAGIPDSRLTAAIAHGNIARLMRAQSRTTEARDHARSVIELLGDPANEEAQALVGDSGNVAASRTLADALAAEAEYLYAERRYDEADARCRDLEERFRAATDEDLVEQVAWARQTLEHSQRYSRRRRFGFRR